MSAGKAAGRTAAAKLRRAGSVPVLNRQDANRRVGKASARAVAAAAAAVAAALVNLRSANPRVAATRDDRKQRHARVSIRRRAIEARRSLRQSTSWMTSLANFPSWTTTKPMFRGKPCHRRKVERHPTIVRQRADVVDAAVAGEAAGPARAVARGARAREANVAKRARFRRAMRATSMLATSMLRPSMRATWMRGRTMRRTCFRGQRPPRRRGQRPPLATSMPSWTRTHSRTAKGVTRSTKRFRRGKMPWAFSSRRTWPRARATPIGRAAGEGAAGARQSVPGGLPPE